MNKFGTKLLAGVLAVSLIAGGITWRYGGDIFGADGDASIQVVADGELSETTTELTTEITTEVTTEVTTEITTEVTTEVTTASTTEATTEATTEEATTEEEPSQYANRIFDSTDTPESVLAMARDGLDLDRFFFGTGFAGMTVEELEGYVAEGLNFESIIKRYDSTGYLDVDSIWNDSGLERAGGYYRTVSCSQIFLFPGSGVGGGAKIYDIKVQGSTGLIQGFCMDAGKNMTANALFHSGVKKITNKGIRRAYSWYVNDSTYNAETRLIATQYAIWQAVDTGEELPAMPDSLKSSLQGSGKSSVVTAYEAIRKHTSEARCYEIAPKSGEYQRLVVGYEPQEFFSYVSFCLRKTDSFDGSSVKDCTFTVQQYQGSDTWKNEGTMSWSEADNCYVSGAIQYDEINNKVSGFRILESSAGAGHVVGEQEVFHQDGVTRYQTPQDAIKNRISASGSSSITNAPKTIPLSIRKYAGSQIANDSFSFVLQEYVEDGYRNHTSGNAWRTVAGFTYDAASKKYVLGEVSQLKPDGTAGNLRGGNCQVWKTAVNGGNF